jgi:hypothetical protein
MCWQAAADDAQKWSGGVPGSQYSRGTDVDLFDRVPFAWNIGLFEWTKIAAYKIRTNYGWLIGQRSETGADFTRRSRMKPSDAFA